MLPVVAIVVQMLVCAPATARAPQPELPASTLQPASSVATDVPFAEQSAAEGSTAPHLATFKQVEPVAANRLVPVIPDEFMVVCVVRLPCGRHVLQRSSLPPPLSA